MEEEGEEGDEEEEDDGRSWSVITERERKEIREKNELAATPDGSEVEQRTD